MRGLAGRLAALLLLASCAAGPSLEIPPNRHGLPVVADPSLHRRLVEASPSKALVPVTALDPTIRLDIRYATADNFMKTQLYPAPAALLRCEAARALARVQADLEPRGLGLKVFDAYRPYAVTEAMWEPWKDPDYVADPAKGSRHNRGAAVDVTLVDLATGEELPMPTGYDDFTRAAWHDHENLPPAALQNRAVLRTAMERRGFQPLASEWWHYDYQTWRDYELLDLTHAELARMGGRCR